VAFSDIPRIYCFSLGDFYNFERCYFGFLVKHHLQKKYELAEGSFNSTVGSLLDLAIKKLHLAKAYNQPLDYLLPSLFKAAEQDIREQADREGPHSFYGSTIKFLTPEAMQKAQQVFKNYYLKRKGKINRAILNKRFWECILEGERVFKIWGGPDAIEQGDDGIPEIVDYKYFEDAQKGRDNLDMDLMPKLYTLLCSTELIKSGYKRVRFRVRSWTDPEDESLYEQFDLDNASLLKDFFRHKITKILSVAEISFCGKDYCKACNSEQKDEWIKQLKLKNKDYSIFGIIAQVRLNRLSP